MKKTPFALPGCQIVSTSTARVDAGGAELRREDWEQVLRLVGRHRQLRGTRMSDNDRQSRHGREDHRLYDRIFCRRRFHSKRKTKELNRFEVVTVKKIVLCSKSRFSAQVVLA